MTIWGPAFDAEIEYRRQTLSAAAVGRRGGWRRGSRGRRASSAAAGASRRAARAAGTPAVGTPLVAGFTAAPAARR